MAMNNKSYSPFDTLFFLLMFFYFYNVKFFLVPVSSYVWSSLVFVFLFLLYVVKDDFKVNKCLFNCVGICFVFVALVFISLFFNINDFQITVVSVVIAIFIASVLFPYVVFKYFKDDYIIVFKFIGFVGIINAFFIVGMFFIADFKFFWNSIVDATISRGRGSVDLVNSFMSLRMIGVTGSSTYGIAFSQNVFLVFYMLYIFYTNKKPSSINYFLILFCLASGFLAARTGFVLLPFILVLHLYLFGFLSLSRLLIIGCFFSMLSVVVFRFFINDDFSSFFVKWILEIFKDGTDSGSFKVNMSMFSKLKFSDFSFLGYFKLLNESGGYYLGIDIGYYRAPLAIGLLGFFVLLCMIIIPLFKELKKNKNDSSPILFSTTIIIIMILILLFKGAIIFDFYPIFGVLSLLFVSIGVCKDKNRSSVAC